MCCLMGKSLTSLEEIGRRIISPKKLATPKSARPISKIQAKSTTCNRTRVDLESTKMGDQSEGSNQNQDNQRIPLAEVVSDCVERWFQDTLKEAKSGDVSMQVLVGQMYYNGYGVSRDPQKGRAWISRASRSRSSVWKVFDKRPGYNASDSDSDTMADAK